MRVFMSFLPYCRSNGWLVGSPDVDHTTGESSGMYLLLEATTLSYGKAYLESQALKADQTYCITLYTWLPGNAKLSLQYKDLVSGQSRVAIPEFSGTHASWEQVGVF